MQNLMPNFQLLGLLCSPSNDGNMAMHVNRKRNDSVEIEMEKDGSESLLDRIHGSVMRASEDLSHHADPVCGYDFDQGVNYGRLLESMINTGFQASHLGQAISHVNQMVSLFILKCLMFFDRGMVEGLRFFI